MTITTEQALETLAVAGFSVVQPAKPFQALSPAEAASRLGCSTAWVRRHLDEFRGAFRVGSVVRIPESDLETFARRARVLRK